MPRSIYIRTEESRRRSRESHLGKKLSIDTRRKMSLSKMGKNHPLYGKHHSPDTIKKMSETRKKLFQEGKVFCPMKNPVVAEKVSKSLTGKSFSEEHRKKISIRKKKEYAEGRTLPFIGAKGKDNLSYVHGRAYDPHTPDFNIVFKNSIRMRDNHICMLCRVHRERLNKALAVHHINYDKKLSIPQNCVSLCSFCHGKTNFNRAEWIKFFHSLLYKEYGYQYHELTGEVIMNITGEEKCAI